MSGFDLGDYVPVAERIVTFYELHPDGRIVAAAPHPVEVGSAVFIASHVEVYADPDATQPKGSASAWEPFPGKTPYTRDSEAMNAETSAIGRALGAAGVAVRRSLATSDEVQLRQGTPDGVQRGEAKGELLGALHGDTNAAKWWWTAAFPEDPERVPREALDAVCRAASQSSALSAGGGDQEPEASGASAAEREEVDTLSPASTAGPSVDEGSPDSGPGAPSGAAAARAALPPRSRR